MKKLILFALVLTGTTLFLAPAEGQIFRRSAPVVVVAAPQPAAQVVAAPKAPGPVFCAAVRAHLRKEFRKQGMGLIESIRKANDVTDEVIAGLIPDAEKVSGQKVGAIGDGKIIDAIIEWFKSPQGQALIAALVQLILGLLAVVSPGSPEFYVLLDMLAQVRVVLNL